MHASPLSPPSPSSLFSLSPSFLPFEGNPYTPPSPTSPPHLSPPTESHDNSSKSHTRHLARQSAPQAHTSAARPSASAHNRHRIVYPHRDHTSLVDDEPCGLRTQFSGAVADSTDMQIHP
ncbi:uncharacterized protein LDX57_011088 [Aspergillus melleus]|uniref:uncharacterized protein n=1 Tax=Aspergillus melleus TaxID=138277 RepID=UPI001E8E496C|nr:uncharacterized protein LDX57_011088 [Aspergillus melleus]KAH8433454.1 hypothetical protein LDX57_011088 [Aspergillus melleus]